MTEPITSMSWSRLKKIVASRDEKTCVYCNEFSPDGWIDHVLPLSKGGSDALHNLVWTCQSCNLAKKDKTLREWVKRNDSGWLLSLHKSFDLHAAGWDCDCGGHGWLSEWLPPLIEFGDNLLSKQKEEMFSQSLDHGHHHPDCPIVAKTGKNYHPYFSKMINGNPYLFCVILYPESLEEDKQIRRNDFWHKHFRGRLSDDEEVWRCSREIHDEFQTYLLSNEFTMRYKAAQVEMELRERFG